MNKLAAIGVKEKIQNFQNTISTHHLLEQNQKILFQKQQR